MNANEMKKITNFFRKANQDRIFLPKRTKMNSDAMGDGEENSIKYDLENTPISR